MLTRWKVCVQWNRVIVLREQARSHKGFVGFADHCGSEPAREGVGNRAAYLLG
jgi:hypothetical protein